MSEQSLPATPENIQKAVNLIEREQGGGGTELLPAFRRALALEKAEGSSRTIVIATDGYVTVEEEVFDLIRNNLGDANVFAFGIGSTVNRHIIEGMARVGMGEPFVITKPEEAPGKAERFRTLIQFPVLTQVKIDFQDFTPYEVEPLNIPDVLAERPVIVFGKWRGQPRGKIRLTGISGNGSYREMIDVRDVRPLKTNSALRYLWARHRVAILSDYNELHPTDGRVKEVTELGLAYNLLTAYTSFVAVDTEVRNTAGQSTTVKQPLPLPQGVSDYAVGGMKLSQEPTSFMTRKEVAGQLATDAVTEQKGFEEKDKSKVTVGDVIVPEGLSKEVVLKLVQKKAGEIERCYFGREVRGKLILELTVDLDGKVRSVKITSSPLKDSGVERCVTESVKKWQFPAVQGGREVKATITLVFG
jgi:Ca-activated chloride channel family protein